MLPPNTFTPPLNATQQDIRTGMMLVNALSVPGRGGGLAIEWLCKSHPHAEKVCRAAGDAIQFVVNAASPYVPQAVKHYASEAGKKINELPARMEQTYGIPKSETSYFLQSAGIVGSYLMGAGMGKTLGQIGKTITSIKQSNAFQKTIGAANNNYPYLFKSQTHYLNLNNGFLIFSSFKRTDGSMTIFVESLDKKRSLSVKKAGSLAASKEAIAFAKTYARENGATKLYLQWEPVKLSLYNIAQKKGSLVGISYLGKAPYPTRVVDGLYPCFKVDSYIRAAGGDAGIPFYKVDSFVKVAGGDAASLFNYALGTGSLIAFTEGVLQNGLQDSYNSSNSDNPISEGEATGGASENGEIGGVGQKECVIEGLFSSLKELEENHHLFYIPALDGTPPFKIEELQQILRELAVGIFVHDSIPFFSLHFDTESHLYPLIHPCYQNTLVGEIIGLSDYYMKGCLNGAYFDKAFIQEWIKSRPTDEKLLRSKAIDVHELCEGHFGTDMPYFSIRELLYVFKLNEKEFADPLEHRILSDYSGFRSSFRIIVKQNSIRKAGNLFLLDGDFDVFYTIQPDRDYEEELKKYRYLNGKDPVGYTRLVKAYDAMAYQIKKIMSGLPQFKELIAKLKVINFYSYYFKSLKLAQKIPLFESFEANSSFVCPSLFPHLPIFSEQLEEEKLLSKRVVGGCGMNVRSMPVTYDSFGEQLLNSLFLENIHSSAETWMLANTNEKKGYVFKLNIADFPAEKNQDYEWMSFSLTRTSPDTALHKAATFNSMQSNAFETFHELIQREDCKNSADPNGFTLIHYAAVHQSPDYLLELIHSGIKVENRDAFGYTPLHCAANAGLLENIKILLKYAPKSINCRANNRANALNLAVQQNHLSAVMLLIRQGADVNNRMSHGMTPLYSAVHHGFQEIALELLKAKGIDINCPLEDGTSVLYTAVTTEQMPILAKLISMQADIKLARIDSYTAIHIAAKKGSLPLLELLSQHPNFDPNMPLKSGKTPLHLAVEHNHASIVQFLLKKGASVKKFGWDRETPLLAACLAGNSEAVGFMMEQAQQTVTVDKKSYRMIDFPNVLGISPLTAAFRGKFYEILHILMHNKVSLPDSENLLLTVCKAKIDPLFIRRLIEQNNFSDEQLQKAYYISAKHGHNQMAALFQTIYQLSDFKDINGWTSAHFAAFYDNISVIKKMELTPVQLTSTDKSGKTLATIAAEQGSHRVLKILLEAMQKHQVPFERQDRGYHLLAAAIKAGEQECASLIIQHMESPNLPLDRLKRTASHLAAIRGDVEMLEFLRIRGGKFDQMDGNGKTVFHYAFEYNWKDLIDYLLCEKYEFTLPADLLAFVAGVGKSWHIEALSKKGLYPKDSSNIRESPIFNAISENNLMTFKLLAQQGANLARISHTFSANSHTPSADLGSQLGEAVFAQHCPHPAVNQSQPTERRFASKKCEKSGLETIFSTGDTPLVFAAKEGCHEILEVILQVKLPAVKAKEGNAALRIAVQFGHEACVKTLLKAGFNPFKKNDHSQNAFDIAIQRGFPHLVLLLQNKESKLQEIKSKTIHALESGNVELFFQQVDFLPLNHPISFEIEGKSETLPLLHLIYKKASRQTRKKILNQFLKLPKVDKNVLSPKQEKIYHLMAKNAERINFSKIDPLTQNKNGVSLLHVCAINSSQRLQEALNHTDKVDITDRDGLTPLHYAIISKQQEQVKMLLKHGADPNQPTKHLETPLLLAVEYALPIVAQMLLKRGAKVHERGLSSLQTPLHLAVSKGLIDLTKILITYGADVNKEDLHGVRPIHLAAYQGSLPLIRLLIAAGASLKVKDHEGKSVAHWGAQSKCPAIIDYLKEAGVSFHKGNKIVVPSLRAAKRQHEGVTPLHLASETGSLKMVKKIVEEEADINSVDQHHFGALFYAMKSGKVNVVNFFIDSGLLNNVEQKVLAIEVAIIKDAVKQLAIFYPNGASIDRTLNAQGSTGLHYAAFYGAKRCAHYFIEKGADPHMPKLNGETAFELAIQTHHLYLAVYLSESVPTLDVHRKLKEGKSYLHIACEQEDLETASWLIKKGVAIDEIDERGMTATHAAAKKGNFQLLHLLLACGANPDQRTAQDKTVLDLLPYENKRFRILIETYRKAQEERNRKKESKLHAAIRLNDSTHFALLVSFEDMNFQSQTGKTPLHLAATHQNPYFFNYLVEKGALLELEDDKGRTPLRYAVAKGKNFNLIQSLVHLGVDLYGEDIKGVTILHAIKQRKDRFFAVKLFRFIHKQLPKRELFSFYEMAQAIRSGNTAQFFQQIYRGHPFEGKDHSLVQAARKYQAYEILDCLTFWFGINT